MNDSDPSPPEETSATSGPPPAPHFTAQTSDTPPAPNQVPLSPSEIQSKKLAAGLLGILVGGFGIHKFYLGYQQEGLIMLLVTVLGGGGGTMLTCGLLAPVFVIMPIIGMVEGILYLTKSDEEFANTYLRARRPWF